VGIFAESREAMLAGASWRSAPEGAYAYIELEVNEVTTEVVPRDEGQR
jgi:hypothetical protein